MRKSLRFAVLFLSAFLFFTTGMTITTQEAGAQEILIGTTGTGGTISTLVELDPATGNLIRTIGSVGYTVNGLVYDHTTGRLFASTSVTDPSFNGLIEINLSTGAGTPVGESGWGLGGAAVTNITVDSAGQMYGWWDPGEDDLVRIDKTTGVATRVGESNVGTGQNGLDFDNSGTLYMVNYGGDYYSVNTATGLATYVNTIGSMAHHGKFRPTTNIWYGINATSGSRSLILANLTTGAILSTIPTVNDLHTLEFISGATQSVSGTVTYTGAGTGQISIAAFDGEDCGDGDYTEVLIPGPGPYTLNLSPGTYYICACRDTNNNGTCPDDPSEPASGYNGNPVTVTEGGEPITGINIALEGQPQRVESVPTMTEWGMIIFIALAGLGSIYYLKRKRMA